jgi:hypothetical protein
MILDEKPPTDQLQPIPAKPSLAKRFPKPILWTLLAVTFSLTLALYLAFSSKRNHSIPTSSAAIEGNESAIEEQTKGKQLDRQALKDLIDRHLAKTQSEIEALDELGYSPIEELFLHAFSQVYSYADTCLGWGSKWRLVRDRLPWSDGTEHQQFLKEKFEEQIFSPATLEKAIRQSIQERFAKIRDLENEMLLRMRADIEKLPDYDAIALGSESELTLGFENAFRKASETASQDLSSDIESQLVSLVAGEVLAQVAVRLGVSAGILGTGAASGWATFGIGLVAGLVVDQIVSRLWDYFADPELELAIELSRSLSQLRDLICHGDSQTIGLDGQFKRWNSQRETLRRTAVYDLFALPMQPSPSPKP